MEYPLFPEEVEIPQDTLENSILFKREDQPDWMDEEFGLIELRLPQGHNGGTDD